MCVIGESFVRRQTAFVSEEPVHLMRVSFALLTAIVKVVWQCSAVARAKMKARNNRFCRIHIRCVAFNHHTRCTNASTSQTQAP